MIIRKRDKNNPENYKYFKVRRGSFLVWLRCLQQQLPLYSNMEIDHTLLSYFPVNGYVENDMRVQVDVKEEEEDSDKLKAIGKSNNNVFDNYKKDTCYTEQTNKIAEQKLKKNMISVLKSWSFR